LARIKSRNRTNNGGPSGRLFSLSFTLSHKFGLTLIAAMVAAFNYEGKNKC